MDLLYENLVTENKLFPPFIGLYEFFLVGIIEFN
jgi:hypothetical protein